MRRLLFLLCVFVLLVTPVLAQNAAISLDWPANQTTVSGTIDLMGTVNPVGLQSYFFEASPYDLDDPTAAQWLPVTLPSLTPVVNGVIGQWMTTTLPDGLYQLRLHVVLSSGTSAFYAIAPIAVNNTGSTISSVPVIVIATPDPSIAAAGGGNPPAQQPPPVQQPPPPPVEQQPQIVNIPSPQVVNDLPVPLGGHVLHFDGAAQAFMQVAGMTWVKWQVPFVVNSDADFVSIARDRINWGHEAGFKVLLSITGEVGELGDMGDSYYPLFAEFLAEVAANGADAIEVWNEMNIAREWPQGRIDPVAYTEMLRQAYTAIKAAHADTMVISGALAPTGAEGLFGLDNVWNDDRYYAGMANAGTANYADCIGLHYNEGIIAPSQLGGDPRQPDYPTRYFVSMLDRVYWPFRDFNVPLCLTEMGYLSPEGFGPLPEGFAWAANTSVAQQAAWLRDAVRIAGNYHNREIALIIIWNVDFDNYEEDPQAGYAMMRPDGTCPACDTLASLRVRPN